MLVIDDHPLFRRGARHLMDIDGGFEVVGEASSGREGLDLALSLRPDLVLLDLNMSDMDGTETLGALREAGIDARVVMLTVSDEEEDLVAALRAGADGYLLKHTEPEDLLRQLRQVLSGRLILTDELTERLAEAMRRQPAPGERVVLTRREQEVLDQIAAGLSNKQIARELGLSEGTVKVHVKHLLKKLGMHSRLEAALWVVEQQK
ncbi:Nitrate/nitrite response regulator protein [Thioalkalivibrio nitratireducens DSM 14787]|uniref:Nitrate/nitrite response regulator protein n=1 Tax=Thioalkalivibrio nitratireducens (strain DSM 14787 / UNIQEM 213 / ALEN2) TaxID=1255043 RepID=L0DSK2_THIND|nr:Nitrate/nitrite response regulator protein [Thioalkalivibrio nitratireducens DSM 14787]